MRFPYNYSKGPGFGEFVGWIMFR